MLALMNFVPVVAGAAPGGAPGGTPGGPTSMFGPMGYMILLLGIMYFLIFRPQQQKAKHHREMVSRLKAGDQVVTNGGIYGEVTAVDETSLMLKVAEGVEIKTVRSAVSSVVTDDGEEDDQGEKTTRTTKGDRKKR